MIVDEEKPRVEREEAMKKIVKKDNQVMIGTKFRVFKDLTIEIPANFTEEEFDEFLIQVHQKGIYDS